MHFAACTSYANDRVSFSYVLALNVTFMCLFVRDQNGGQNVSFTNKVGLRNLKHTLSLGLDF